MKKILFILGLLATFSLQAQKQVITYDDGDGNANVVVYQGTRVVPVTDPYGPNIAPNPTFDTDSDWLRFERWMAGKPIRGKLRDFIPPNFNVRRSEDLTDGEIFEELEKLIKALAKLHFSVDFKQELPPR